MRPVTALWLIAVPLMDMAAIMIRRVRRGDSPFKPDREHLHHIFQRLGLGPRQTLVAICLIAAMYASFGVYGEATNIPEVTMFGLFIGCFILLSWRIYGKLRVSSEPNYMEIHKSKAQRYYRHLFNIGMM